MDCAQVPFLQHLKNWLDINADMGNIPPQLWWLFPKTMKSAHDSADFLKAERRPDGDTRPTASESPLGTLRLSSESLLKDL